MDEEVDIKERRQRFLVQFNFQKKKRGFVGVERGFFLRDLEGFVPESSQFLRAMNDPEWTHELSACQVKHRTTPAPHTGLVQIRDDLGSATRRGYEIAQSMGLQLVVMPVVASGHIPLDVYPDERYRKIAQRLHPDLLSAACRVTGVYLHFGMGSMEEAIEASNKLTCDHAPELVQMGNLSNGARLRFYCSVATVAFPSEYRNVKHFHGVAISRGFEKDPRDCWDLIRISRHGTIELRMFDMTDDNLLIIRWIQYVSNILF